MIVLEVYGTPTSCFLLIYIYFHASLDKPFNIVTVLYESGAEIVWYETMGPFPKWGRQLFRLFFSNETVNF